MAKKKKIKIPKSVLDLRMSPKRYAKKHRIRLKGKHMSKKDKKRNIKRLRKAYSVSAITGLDKAVKILAENPDAKKINKVKNAVDNILVNPEVMRRVAKIYKKNPDQYSNMIYLPRMIMNTLIYYSSESLSDEEKEIGKTLDKEELTMFCRRILKKEIKRYENFGLDNITAFRLATVIPTSKLFKNREWYRVLINEMYNMAAESDVDIDKILKAVMKIDKKKKYIDKKDFLEGFFLEFIMRKNTNKSKTFTESQKELHEGLIERALTYLDNLKSRKLRDMLRQYIKRRKTAESYKNDGKRVIKFTDHANSNSPYSHIKSVVQDLISDNSSNELYLS